MPLKKKKYNARFPAGRIKKIMQSDEEVGKVAQAVPIIISRTLELFVESMLTKTLRITNARNAKTLSPSHMKQCIMSESRFDFLRELVKNVPDINVAEEQQGDNYPERRESSEDGTMISLMDSNVISNANGQTNNPNGGSATAWTRTPIDGTTDASGCSTANAHPNWKYSKQHSLDSLATGKLSINYSPNTASNDADTPINYSIKIKLDDKPTPAKLLRMESTPASFGLNSNVLSPIIAPNYVPLTTAKSSDSDKPPIINFDFSKIPLLPSVAACPPQITSAANHSHSVSNLLKLNDNPSTTTTDTAKNDVSKTSQRSTTIKSQPTKPVSHSFASSTITSNTSLIQNHSSTIHSSSPSSSSSSSSSVPVLSYHIPLSTTVGTSSTLEMDEDYDNI